MPLLNPEQIQALVDEDSISALTLDTSIFDQFRCNLGYKSLTALGQFKGTNVRVLLSTITLGEVKPHIGKSASDAADKARAAINQYLKVWRTNENRAEAEKSLDLDKDGREHAGAQVASFVESIVAVEVPVEPGVSVAELVSLYFASEAPFSAKDGKKSEFPDAIALMSLDAWAKKNGGYVLAVSKDSDWRRYAEKSDYIICIDDLAASHNLFNTESSVVAARIEAQVRERSTPALFQAIEHELERYIEDFDVEASADFIFEDEIESSQVLGWSVPESSNFDVVASDRSTVSLAFSIEVQAEFIAGFSFSVRDAIDRDYVPMGSTSAHKTEKLLVPIVATLHRDELLAQG